MFWNKPKTLTIVAAVLMVAGLVTCVRAELVARYEFDGNAENSVGPEHGTLMGGAGYVTDPDMGFVLVLDGIDGYVEFSDILVKTTEFTIAAWANQLGQGGGNVRTNIIFSQRAPSAYAGDHDAAITLYTEMQWNNPIAAVQLRSNGGIRQDLHGNQMSYGEWHHYALTVSADTLVLYVDGAEVDTLVNNQHGDYHTDVELVEIGRHRFIAPGTGWINGGFFNGMIDDVRIYDFAMTAEELNTLVIPEPGALSLFALGGLILRKKRIA